MDPYQVVRDFEAAVCEYTGAPYCVTTNSCTMALTLAVAWHMKRARFLAEESDHLLDFINDGVKVSIPKRTYVSVPMAILHAGARPTFRDEEWSGAYQLKPLPVFDSARLFTGGMWNCMSVPSIAHKMVCLSFHASKTLGDTQGGAILLDDPEAVIWLRRARFDGRAEGVPPKDDFFRQIGWHAYMSPDVAARLLLKLHSLPRHNAPLPNDQYPDLSTLDIFQVRRP